jgi:hypothetical protein
MLAILVVIRKTLIYGAGLALLSFLLWYLYIVYATRIFINSDGELFFSGRITFGSVAEVRQLYEDSTIKPTILHIRSPGGYMAAGGEFGEWIHKQGLDVKVTKKCYSTCANYVFPAGKRSLLGQNGKLLWHASYQSTSFLTKSGDRVDEEKTRQTTNVDMGRKLERKFFDQIGVDPQLPTYGEAEHYATLHGNLKYDAGYDGFYYSVEDMSKMGINVVLLDGVWRQGEWLNKSHDMYKAVVPDEYRKH